jgi:dihydropteroate synthase
MIPPEKFSIRFLPSDRSGLRRAFQELGVDPYGIAIMLPKAIPYLVEFGPVSCPAALILKQEMLSLGGDCALPRDAVSGRIRKTRCILIGNSSHLLRLREKLRRQPFGLRALAAELSLAIAQYEKKGRRQPRIMGIINLTPDSFSGDGICGADPARILEIGQAMAADGADIIDIGGESSRPGARSVPAAVEVGRVIPAVKILASKLRIPVSIDTRKAEVARKALDSGAAIVNDISGLRDPAMARLCARYGCGIVIMHMRGTPATMKRLTGYASLMEEIGLFFRARIDSALKAGVKAERIIIDPGIGFAKDWRQNLAIIKNLGQFKSLGAPLLVGVSRKSFLGKILDGAPPQDRLAATIAACTLAVANGADIVRVHDVREAARAVKTACAIIDA